MKRKIVIPVLVIAVLLGAAGLLWSGWFNRKPDNRILVSGNLELTEVDISFKVPGRLIERNADEGQFVKKGMLIARIDRDQYLRQRSRDEAGVESAESQWTQSRTSVLWQQQTLASDIDLRRAELREAQAHLAELLAGSRPQEIQQARSSVADARSQAEQAKLDWDRAQTLYKDDDISKAQFDQYRARFDSTAAVLKQAEERLALVLEGPRKEDIEAGRAQVARAEAAIRYSEANRLEVQRRQEDIAARRAEVDRARQQVGITDTQLADTIAYCPIDGVVLVKSAEVGEVLAAGTTVLTVGDVEHPWLRAYIGERDLGRVKLGMKAKLSTDSYPGKVYWGKVSFIASDAEFTPKQIQTQEERVKLVYRIKIEVDNPQRELKSNMPVDGEIVLEP